LPITLSDKIGLAYAQNTKNEVPKAISDQFHISVNDQYNLRESEDVF
jgi:hypothetical protein